MSLDRTPIFRYSVRVDGTFVPGFVEELQA